EADFLFHRGYKLFTAGPSDRAEAIRCFETAAKKGHLLARCALATGDAGDPDKTKCAGGQARLKRLLSDLKELALSGNPYAEHFLGVMYADGYGVKKDEKEAIRWFKKAADQNDDRSRAKLGWIYAQGIGVEKDETE